MRRARASSSATVVNGELVDENNRALVLTFDPGQLGPAAVGPRARAFDDPRSEGDRVVVVQHSSISADPRFDGVAVRNVEVSLRDNDTPGVYVTEVAPGTTAEDGRTLVIEGSRFGPLHRPPRRAARRSCQKRPGRGDDPREARPRRREPAGDRALEPRRALRDVAFAHSVDPLLSTTYYTIAFDATNWDDPVRVVVEARDDAAARGPADGRRSRSCATTTRPTLDGLATIDPTSDYVFPNLRSGTGRTDIEVHRRRDRRHRRDRERRRHARRAVRRRGVHGARRRRRYRSTTSDPAEHDEDARPGVGVDVAILTDGMVDVRRSAASPSRRATATRRSAASSPRGCSSAT